MKIRVRTNHSLEQQPAELQLSLPKSNAIEEEKIGDHRISSPIAKNGVILEVSESNDDSESQAQSVDGRRVEFGSDTSGSIEISISFATTSQKSGTRRTDNSAADTTPLPFGKGCVNLQKKLSELTGNSFIAVGTLKLPSPFKPLSNNAQTTNVRNLLHQHSGMLKSGFQLKQQSVGVSKKPHKISSLGIQNGSPSKLE